MDTNANIQDGITSGLTQTEQAVEFINAQVLTPPEATPMTPGSKIMMDQAKGMMALDLQTFLKGFEQVGLIAVSRLANNLLTYGSPSYPGPSPKKDDDKFDFQDPANGNEGIRDLFNIISEYAEAKARIANMTSFSGVNTNEGQNNDTSNDSSDDSPNDTSDDHEKKNA